MKNFFCVWMIVVLTVSVCSGQDARSMLRDVSTNFLKVKDYTVDATIRLDVSFIKMLPVNAVVYFKQPDKIRVKTKGIAILPKQGMDDMLRTLSDTNAYMAVFFGKDKIQDRIVSVINLIPLSDTSDMILGKFWIDSEQKLVLRSQITSKSNGTVQADYNFSEHKKYALPSSVLFTVDTRKFKIPKALAADINSISNKKEDTPGDSKGRIEITFSNYRINTGLSDSFFKNSNKDN